VGKVGARAPCRSNCHTNFAHGPCGSKYAMCRHAGGRKVGNGWRGCSYSALTPAWAYAKAEPAMPQPTTIKSHSCVYVQRARRMKGGKLIGRFQLIQAQLATRTNICARPQGTASRGIHTREAFLIPPYAHSTTPEGHLHMPHLRGWAVARDGPPCPTQPFFICLVIKLRYGVLLRDKRGVASSTGLVLHFKVLKP